MKINIGLLRAMLEGRREATSILIAALLLGCGASPRENFYTLPTDRTSIRPFDGSSTTGRIVVGPITVPEMVDRPQFVVRVGPNQVAIAEQQRWAEPLKFQISRVVAQNLAQFMGATDVRTAYQTRSGDAEYRVLLDIQQFESTLGQAVNIEVFWTIRGTSRDEMQTGRTLNRQPVVGKDYDALVAAHGRAFAVVSLEIATAIHQLASRSQEKDKQEMNGEAKPGNFRAMVELLKGQNASTNLITAGSSRCNDDNPPISKG